MSDSIVVNVLSPEVTNINVNDTGENIYINPLTLNQGIINHSVTHQSGGSDELLHNLLGGLQGGSGGNYYHLTSGQYANLVTGAVIRPSDTGAFYPASNPSGFITGVDLSAYVTGDVVRPSETGSFITVSQTGAFYPRSNPSGFIDPSQTGAFYAASNPSGFITGVDLSAYVTGEVVRPSQTGAFYPASNPSGFITGVDLSAYVTGSVVRPSETGNFIAFTALTGDRGDITITGNSPTNLNFSIDSSAVTNTKIADGAITTAKIANFNVTTDKLGSLAVTTNIIASNAVTNTKLADMASQRIKGRISAGTSDPEDLTASQVRTLIDFDNTVSGLLSGYVTGSVVRPSETGSFITTAQTGAFYPVSNPSGYITGSVVRPNETGSFLTTGAADVRYVLLTGNQTISGVKAFVSRPTVNGTGVMLSGESLGVNTGELTGAFYPLNSNPSNYVTGSVVRPSETGSFITSSQTGAFYPTSNPSGYITGVDLSNYATIPYTTGISGNLQQQITALNNQTGGYVLDSETGNFITTSQTGAFYAASNPSGFVTGIPNIVYTTGDQDISGLKDFQTRPTVVDVPVLLSGDAVDTIHLYGKNHEAFTLYKGYPVYISGANGANPLISLAANSGETTSSKTIGLMAADTASNAFGYIITEGFLEGFDTSAASAGDPMWLGPTGNILYGTGNKPYGNNNLVALGVVLRSNVNNGKVYVKIQNGFEIDELHGVYAKNPQNKDSLFYNSTSGAWFARQVTTGDVSGINNYYLASNPSGFVTGSVVRPSETGNFITTSQTGVFYPTSNPSGFVTGSVVRPSETGIFLTTTPASFTSDTLATALSDENGSSGGFVRGVGATLTNVTLTGVPNFAATNYSYGVGAREGFLNSLSNRFVYKSGLIPFAEIFDDFPQGTNGGAGTIGTHGWTASRTAGGANASYAPGTSSSDYRAYGVQSLSIPATSGSNSALILAAGLGAGGPAASPFGMSMQSCFCINTTVASSFFMSFVGGGTTISSTLNFGSSSLDLTATNIGGAGVNTISVATGLSLSAGNFISGTRYRLFWKPISTTQTEIYLASAPWNSSTWTTIIDNTYTHSGYSTPGFSCSLPWIGVSTQENVVKTGYLDWVAIRHETQR